MIVMFGPIDVEAVVVRFAESVNVEAGHPG